MKKRKKGSAVGLRAASVTRARRAEARAAPRSRAAKKAKRASGAPDARPSMLPKLKSILGQPSWTISAKGVEVSITRAGGMIAPVTFTLGKKKVAPMHVAPWHNEKIAGDVPTIVRVLRGDFFCMPFGGNTTPFGREQHPVHGEVANREWTVASFEQNDHETTLRLAMNTRVRKASVEKCVRLLSGHQAVYQRHTIRGASGPMSFGHHAMLRFPDEGGVISTAPFSYGQVFPEPVERPENRGYSLLKPGAVFDSLDEVPTITGESTSLALCPQRRGYEDLVMLATARHLDFGWTAAVFPSLGYAWFALKDIATLPATILWFSNGDRHYAPWNGRHTNVVGLEEVCSHFHPGIAESNKPNAFSMRDCPTVKLLDPKTPTTINYIFGVVAVPPEVKRIDAIERSERGIMLHGGGLRHEVALDMEFMFGRER